MESTATVRNIRNSTDSVISHMETVTWLQSCELLFLGRFAEDHHLPGIPLTPSVDICVEFTADNTSNHPTALISVELCTRFPTRFSMFGAPNTVFDTEYGTQLTFVSPSTLPYRPPLVPLRDVVRYFDNGFASRIDLVALAIHAVSVNTHIDRSTVAQTATRLAERLIMSNPPYLEFTSSQRRVVQDALPGFAPFSAHGLGWWRRSFQ